MNSSKDHVPVPITRLKIKKDRWLMEPVKYESDRVKQDIIEEMCQSTWIWINSRSDLEPITDYDTFRSDFINLIYDKYIK